MRNWCSAIAAMALALLPAAALAKADSDTVSRYLTAPADPLAVTVAGAGDGIADDSDALQQAIDRARGKGGAGIVFLPPGRYRLTRTILVPEGVRVFGVGKTRPVLFLADATPGFQAGVATLIAFTGEDQYRVDQVPVPVPTIVPRGRVVRDANSGTFYSAMSNVDIELGEGNPAAAAVRFRVAQHGYLSHMDFRLGSGFAGVYQAGNVMTDVHFHGGRYGIVSEKTSPAWQFTLIDASFEGQRSAAIREHEADLTLVDVAIRDVPVGIDIDEGYSDSLWGKGVRFDHVADAAIVIAAENSVFTQIGFDEAIARDTPVFARFRESGRLVEGKGARYRIASFSHGIAVPGLGQTGAIATSSDIQPLAAWPDEAAPAVRPLPKVADWADVRSLGAKGDGIADDTLALQHAIDAHNVLYFPSGTYRVSGTLRLKTSSVLIGLNPATTRLSIADGTAAFAGVGSVMPLIETARGGGAIVSGLGLATGRDNPRASAIVWRAGADSLLDDVKVLGGAGTPPDAGKPPRDDVRDLQYPGIWVTDGGGGTFVGLWTANPIASAGFMVTNTWTAGHVYQLSNEHHQHSEIVLDNVRNWEFLAPQTEEEASDGAEATSLELRHVRSLLFANYHAYRVTRSTRPARAAVRLFDAGDVRFRNVHVNAESGYAACGAAGCGAYLRASRFPFENAIEDRNHHLDVREREFARLDVPLAPPAVAPATIAGIGPVKKLEDGFYSIGGAAADAKGALYFVEHRPHRIFRWSATAGLEVIRDDPLDPVSLAVEKSGHLLVLSSLGAEGTIYSFDPDATPDGHIRVIASTPVKTRPNAATLVPGNWWANGEFRDQYDSARDRFATPAELFAQEAGAAKAREYVSPDGSLVLPSFRTWQQGPADRGGWRFSDTLDAIGLVAAKPGERVIVTDASEGKTLSAKLGMGGALSDLRTIAMRGGESAVADAGGRVFVANGEVFVYAADGAPIGRIDVPERPMQLVIGGEGGKTLFILTHHALYAAAL